MAVVINTTLEADTKEAQRQVGKLKKEVEKVGKAAKKSGEDISAAMQIGNEATRSLDKISGGLATKLVKVAKAAKLSGKAMRTALISSGIGAAVVAIGLLVEYWDEIAEALGFINNDLERQVELNNQNLETVDLKLRNLKSQIELEKRQGKNVDDLIEKQKALNIEKKESLLISLADEKATLQKLKTQSETLTAWEYFLQGYTGTSEITKEENDALIKQQGIISDLENSITNFDTSLLAPIKKGVPKVSEEDPEVAIKKKALEEIKKLEADFALSLMSNQNQEKIAVAAKYDNLIAQADKYKKDTTALVTAREAEISAINTKFTKIADDKELLKTQKEQERIAKTLQSENAISIAKKRFAAEEIQDEVLRLEKLKEIDLLEAEQEAARLQVIVDNAKDGSDAKMNAEIALNEFLETARQNNLTNEKKVSAASVKIADEERKAKQTALDGYAGAVSSLSNTIGQETAAGKGLAVASALISTYAAITATLENSAKTAAGGIPGYAIAQSISTGIAGLAAVKKIISVKVPGGGGSSQTGSMPTAPQAPAFNVVGASGETQLADAIGSQTQRPARAYVVSNDVTTAQELDRNIIEGASI